MPALPRSWKKIYCFTWWLEMTWLLWLDFNIFYGSFILLLIAAQWKMHACFTLFYITLKVFLLKTHNIYIATSANSFISCCFTSAFTSANIIFYNFLEHQTTLSLKRFLSQIVLFLIYSLKLLHPLNSQNLLSMTKFFCCYSLNCSKSLLSVNVKD